MTNEQENDRRRLKYLFDCVSVTETNALQIVIDSQPPPEYNVTIRLL